MQEKLKLLTDAVPKSNGTSLFPCPTKKISDPIERTSVSFESRPATNFAKILSNKPMSQPTIVKNELSDEVEMLEDELLRLEEQEKEDAEKSLLDQVRLVCELLTKYQFIIILCSLRIIYPPSLTTRMPRS